MAENTVITNKIFNGAVVAAGQSIRSLPIEMNLMHANGFFSLHVVDLTGSGTVTFTYEQSNNETGREGSDYVVPQGAPDIVTDHAATSGPGSDGNALYSFTPVMAKWMRIIATETAQAEAVITAVVAVQ